MATQKHSSLITTLKDIEKHSHILLLPLILLIIFLILHFLLKSVDSNTRLLKKSNASTIVSKEYPYLVNTFDPYLSAESAIIMDNATRTVLYGKNISTRFSMASTTKVMTALVGVDYYKDTDILTARRSNVEGVNVGLHIGEQLTFKNALYAMLLPSGNDVAYLIADNYPGGVNAFLVAMNAKAKSLGLYNTHYADPAGLNDDGNYTTAYELARLGLVARNTPKLFAVMSTKKYSLSDVANLHVFSVSNLNEFLGLYGVIGGKTGFTEGAQGVLLTLAHIKDREYIIVVMRSNDRFLDTGILLGPLQEGVGVFSPR